MMQIQHGTSQPHCPWKQHTASRPHMHLLQEIWSEPSITENTIAQHGRQQDNALLYCEWLQYPDVLYGFDVCGQAHSGVCVRIIASASCLVNSRTFQDLALRFPGLSRSWKFYPKNPGLSRRHGNPGQKSQNFCHAVNVNAIAMENSKFCITLFPITSTVGTLA